jgi:hypothetical protein
VDAGGPPDGVHAAVWRALGARFPAFGTAAP